MTHGAVREKSPPRPEGRRISSSAVGSEPLGKFFNLSDSTIAIQKFVLTRPDRFGAFLGQGTIRVPTVHIVGRKRSTLRGSGLVRTRSDTPTFQVSAVR